ncbi:efflux RND transporter periplasmic adaptor subunit [Variovorax sp. NFACC27]|uniref:efflux RND transporter periplasmic adaptor subunit n=1 Tax=unclassified Variovorax TaxID=663243 RepID=UPI0008966DA9|nr:RND family efflux transporter, MFP subunit [Variovorax sp. NFACC28]SEG98219.1 RND family efflux transporter, MFP subunit [Variovorax sp. NFACC29]SFE05705.1 RND family efflux transporter, MFP subunit [Variovorax sp. NFACC26]SFH13463.1 RND family efflux transporter, MFP subunit [Variovorax sp. NFACC27]
MKTLLSNRKFRICAGVLAVALAVGAVAWLERPKTASTAPTADAKAPSVLTVSVVAPKTENWPDVVQASGQLAAWQEIIVSPETGGLRIAELSVDVGAKVKRGDLLARLASESLQADQRKQQAAVAQARASLEQAVSNLRRAKMVEESGSLSAQKVEDYRISEATSRASLASAEAELDSIQLKLRQTRIVAVDDGVVSSKSAVLGNVVSAGAEMFRMVRQGRIEWRPELDARQVSSLRTGQSVRVTLPDGELARGRVRLVGPTLSTSTGRATVYVSLQANSPARLGTFVNGVIELDPRAAQTLPQTAVTLRDGRAYVYLLGAGGKVSSRPVTTGRRQDGRVEVEGLPPDARVVAEGGAFLSEGAQVTVVQSTETHGAAQEAAR